MSKIFRQLLLRCGKTLTALLKEQEPETADYLTR